MLITIGEAVAYVVSGMYGDVREIGAGIACLIILQVRPCCQREARAHEHRVEQGAGCLQKDEHADRQ